MRFQGCHRARSVPNAAAEKVDQRAAGAPVGRPRAVQACNAADRAPRAPGANRRCNHRVICAPASTLREHLTSTSIVLPSRQKNTPISRTQNFDCPTGTGFAGWRLLPPPPPGPLVTMVTIGPTPNPKMSLCGIILPLSDIFPLWVGVIVTIVTISLNLLNRLMN